MSKDLAVFKLQERYDAFDLVYEMSEVNTDINGERYEMVTQTLADDDFYQGLNMCTVIRRLSDDKLFGFHWWDDMTDEELWVRMTELRQRKGALENELRDVEREYDMIWAYGDKEYDWADNL